MVLRGRNRSARRAHNWERLACPWVEVHKAGSLRVARQAFLDWERTLARLGHFFRDPSARTIGVTAPWLDLRRLCIVNLTMALTLIIGWLALFARLIAVAVDNRISVCLRMPPCSLSLIPISDSNTAYIVLFIFIFVANVTSL